MAKFQVGDKVCVVKNSLGINFNNFYNRRFSNAPLPDYTVELRIIDMNPDLNYGMIYRVAPNFRGNSAVLEADLELVIPIAPWFKPPASNNPIPPMPMGQGAAPQSQAPQASQPVNPHWGKAPPVTSSSGRKITDGERKLIETRIALRKALHGG